MVQKGAKQISNKLQKGKEQFQEEFLSSNSVGRGGTETDLDMFVDHDVDELIGGNDGDDENQAFQTYAGQMNAQSYGALPPTQDYTYEESKEDKKKAKKAESYHALAGSQDFELQKMSKSSETAKSSSKTQPDSYHRLDSEPTKPVT